MLILIPLVLQAGCILLEHGLCLVSELGPSSRFDQRQTGPGRGPGQHRSDCGLGYKGADLLAQALTLVSESRLDRREDIGKWGERVCGQGEGKCIGSIGIVSSMAPAGSFD